MVRDHDRGIPSARIESSLKVSVDRYDTKTATLTLAHNYPPNTPTSLARVNIDQVLKTIASTDLEVGAWLNVVGYVSNRETEQTRDMRRLQAIMLWNAGPGFQVEQYEAALERRRAASS